MKRTAYTIIREEFNLAVDRDEGAITMRVRDKLADLLVTRSRDIENPVLVVELKIFEQKEDA